MRFVVGPDGQVVPDLKAELPGRGIWVTASRAAIDHASRKQLFARAAKAFVRAQPGLADTVERLLSRRCLELLSLAARAGELVCGFDQVKAALKTKPIAALVEARDGASDGRDKLFGIVRHLEPRPALVGAFTGRELGLALGRDYVVHAALETGGLAARFLADLRRLSGFRSLCPEDWRVPAEARLSIGPSPTAEKDDHERNEGL